MFSAVVVDAVTVTKVSSDADIINVGDSVQISCHVSDFAMGDSIIWWKRQDTDLIQMGTNGLLNDVFSGTGRYSAAASEEDDALVMTIQGRRRRLPCVLTLTAVWRILASCVDSSCVMLTFVCLQPLGDVLTATV